MDPVEARRWLDHRLPATLELLRELVGINSHTANRDGVNRQGRVTAERFAPLGFQAEFVPHSDPACGDHVVLTRPGTSARTLALVSHLDTVFPPEEEERNDFRWRPEGDRIYGPGTADIKGGTAMIHLVISALDQLAPGLSGSVCWRVLLNSSEETLSHHFGEVCRSLLDPARTLAALVFEAEGRTPDGTPCAVVARKGRATFRITVAGRAAHAGGRHARGANAIVQIGRVIDRVEALTDHARHLTFNVGVVRGGVAMNRVPHLATADLEMRAFSPEAYREGMRAVLALAGAGDVRSLADGHRCQVRVELMEETSPWSRNSATDGLFERWRRAAESLGAPLVPEERGGLSDGNLLWNQYPTLDGLGPHGDNDHCSERSADGSKVPEYLLVSSVVPKALLNVVAIDQLLGNGE